MSLVTTAYPWNSDNEPPKKRTATMKQSLKTAISPVSSNTSMTTSDYSNNGGAPQAGPVQITHTPVEQRPSQNANQHASRVSELLDKITHTSADNDGAGLVSFNPSSSALSHKWPAHVAGVNPRASNPPVPPSTHVNSGYNQMVPGGTPNISRNIGNVAPVGYSPANGYSVANNHLGNYSQYRAAPTTSMDIRPGTTNAYEDKLMEKINRMIYLLEEQRMEKTNNVMEEFLLYSLLGVFVIYVVDSFSRAGKYVR
jgi:hypothetical protein